MINYSSYEDAIVTILSNQSLYDCKPLPENEADLNRAFIKPQVYVCYSGSEYGVVENLGATVQEETVNFDVIFRVKKRRGNDGLLTILKKVGDLILGREFVGCTKINLVKQGYVDGVQNDWNFVMSFQFITHVVENLPESETVPFKVIDFVEEDEDPVPLPED